MDIRLVGNAIKDTIILDSSPDNPINIDGGIYNIKRFFDYFSNRYSNVHCTPYGTTGNATIKVSYDGRKELISIDWGNPSFKNRQILKQCEWTHVAYLNKLSDLDFTLLGRDCILSTDLCLNEKDDFDVKKLLSDLQHFHFLITSIEDFFILHTKSSLSVKEIAQVLKCHIILHDDLGAAYLDSDGELWTHLPGYSLLTDVNVVGAGDAFAASFMYNYFHYNGDNTGAILSSLKIAHLDAREFIIRNTPT